MRESANVRNHRNPYLKLSYPNGVTLILLADGYLQASSDDVLIVWSL